MIYASLSRQLIASMPYRLNILPYPHLSHIQGDGIRDGIYDTAKLGEIFNSSETCYVIHRFALFYTHM